MKSFKGHCGEIGRLAKGKTAEDLAAKHKVPLGDIEDALSMGKKVEMEHTKDKGIAYKIAMDHVWEDPDYYKKLKKMEEEAPVNNVGGGHIAGIGPGEVPPMRQTRRKDPWRRFKTAVLNMRSGAGWPGPNWTAKGD